MNNYIKLIGTSVVASIIVVLVGFAMYHPKTVVVQQPAPYPITAKGTSPEFSSQYIIVGGVPQWWFSTPMRTATTTLCSFPYPTGTSTLAYVSWNVTTATSTLGLVDIATSTSAWATTTIISKQISVAANAQLGAMWTVTGGTNLSTDNDGTDYVNIMVGGNAPGGFTYGGYCQAVFYEL